jgi:hypothetical protein
MLKQVTKKFSQTSPFSNEWGLQSGSNIKTDKRAIISYNISREHLILSLGIVKAKFSMRETYYSVKQRGYITAEFIPFTDSQLDPKKSTLLIKEKKTAILYSETIYEYLHNKPISVEYRKERENESYKFEIKQVLSDWEWSLQASGNTNDVRKILLKPHEHFFVQKLCSYSIPYIFGWYAAGDSRLAEQSLFAEPESRDPFQNI